MSLSRQSALAPRFDPGISRGVIPDVVSSLVPTGGTTGQVLTKASNDDYDLEWTTVSGGGGGGVTEAQFGFGGTVNPSSEAKSGPYVMAAAATFTEVIVGLSDVSSSSYPIKVYRNAVEVASFTVAAAAGAPGSEHVQAVSIAVVAGDSIQAAVGAAPLADGQNMLVVCR